jgi:hypothetical protein
VDCLRNLILTTRLQVTTLGAIGGNSQRVLERLRALREDFRGTADSGANGRTRTGKLSN